MTQHDRLQQEVARLTQRQDQLERQQRQTCHEGRWHKDGCIYHRPGSVDRPMESLRRDVDWKFEWRVKKAWSRPEIQFLRCMMYTMMIGAVVALYITLAVSIIEAPDERQEMAPPEERPLSSACPRYTDEKTVGPVIPTPGDPRETEPTQGKRPIRPRFQGNTPRQRRFKPVRTWGQVSDYPITQKLAVPSPRKAPDPTLIEPNPVFDVRCPMTSSRRLQRGGRGYRPGYNGSESGLPGQSASVRAQIPSMSVSRTQVREQHSPCLYRPGHRQGLPVRCAGGPHRRCGQHRRVFAPASPPGQPPTGLHQRPVLTPPARLQNNVFPSSDQDISRSKTGRRQNAEIGPQEGGKPHFLPTKPQRGFTPAPLWLNPT